MSLKGESKGEYSWNPSYMVSVTLVAPVLHHLTLTSINVQSLQEIPHNGAICPA